MSETPTRPDRFHGTGYRMLREAAERHPCPRCHAPVSERCRGLSQYQSAHLERRTIRPAAASPEDRRAWHTARIASRTTAADRIAAAAQYLRASLADLPPTDAAAIADAVIPTLTDAADTALGLGNPPRVEPTHQQGHLQGPRHRPSPENDRTWGTRRGTHAQGPLP